jgi:hypothetical protein
MWRRGCVQGLGLVATEPWRVVGLANQARAVPWRAAASKRKEANLKTGIIA